MKLNFLFVSPLLGCGALRIARGASGENLGNLESRVLPYDSIDFSRVLDALSSRGFILKYASTSGEIGLIQSFPRHQIINNREKLSELPAPPESLEYQAFDACTTREERNDDVEKFPLSGRKEGKEEEHGRRGNKYPKPQEGSVSFA